MVRNIRGRERQEREGKQEEALGLQGLAGWRLVDWTSLTAV